MWSKIDESNVDTITIGSLISQSYPDALETIYKVSNVLEDEITLKTDNIINITSFKATRATNKSQLQEEGWFIEIPNK